MACTFLEVSSARSAGVTNYIKTALNSGVGGLAFALDFFFSGFLTWAVQTYGELRMGSGRYYFKA